MANILVVDDELGIRDLLFEILNDEGHNVELAENAAQARAARQLSRPDLVLLDIWMPDTDGVTLLKEWAASGLLNMPVIMMSGHATIDTAVEATRIGAQAFLEKPITLQKLLKAVEQGLVRKTAPPAALAAAASIAAAQTSQPHLAVPVSVGMPMVSSAPALPASHQSFELNQPLREAREVFEREYLIAQIGRFSGNISRTAEFIGMERSALHRKLKSLSID
jgi:DNA-binding NtrC family response regulator